MTQDRTVLELLAQHGEYLRWTRRRTFSGSRGRPCPWALLRLTRHGLATRWREGTDPADSLRDLAERGRPASVSYRSDMKVGRRAWGRAHALAQG